MMNTQCPLRVTSKIIRIKYLYRPFSTTLPTSSDPPPPPPQRPPPAPLPSNIARNAIRDPKRDAGIAFAKNMMKEIDRTRYATVREYDAHRASLSDAAWDGRARDLERKMPRTLKWKVGDVYAPHDLSAVEARKWSRRKSSERDVFDVLGINPLEEYKVCEKFIYEYVYQGSLPQVDVKIVDILMQVDMEAKDILMLTSAL